MAHSAEAIEAEEILRGVLDRWKAGVDAHQPQQVASCFTEDAIFQGLRPYSVGRQGVTDYTDEDYDAVTGVNLRGFFEVSRSAVAAMLSREGGGHLVNISTSLVDHARSESPSALASLTEGGLNAVTKALAIEYADRGIRSNAVALGVIRTPMHPPSTYEALAAAHPLGRLGEIDDVVEAIVYLENAPFVTGEILHVDGGQSAGH